MKNLSRASTTAPDDEDTFNYFKNLSSTTKADYFDYDLEKYALKFLEDYDKHVILPPSDPLQKELLNANFTEAEIYSIIQSLKNGKCAGIDAVPAEFIKSGIDFLTPIIITNLLNYFLEVRDFPSIWCEGLRLALFKAGDRLDPACYRGLTILSIFEKIFEIAFNRRFEFLNEALGKIDRNNGVFLKGSRTTDNIFILQSLVSRQTQLGKNLYLCFVDFSKAFDLVNRNLLFYKLIQCG